MFFVLDEHSLWPCWDAKMGSRISRSLFRLQPRLSVKCWIAKLISVNNPYSIWVGLIIRNPEVAENFRGQMLHAHWVDLLLYPHAVCLHILDLSQIAIVFFFQCGKLDFRVKVIWLVENTHRRFVLKPKHIAGWRPRLLRILSSYI